MTNTRWHGDPGETIKAVVASLESRDGWKNSMGRCPLCSGGTPPFCATPIGMLCVLCAKNKLKEYSAGINIGVRPLSTCFDSLAGETFSFSRLAMLWRYREVLDLLANEPAEMISKAFRLLVRNLGFVGAHPLAQSVRQAALEVCVDIGEPLVSCLLELSDEAAGADSWQFYANIVLTAGHIAPEDDGVQFLLEEAADNPNPEIRLRVLATVRDSSLPLADSLVSGMLHDPDAKVRGYAQKISSGRKKNPALKRVALKADSSQPGELYRSIDSAYSARILKIIYSLYLHPFFPEYDFKVGGNFSINKLKKFELVTAMEKVFKDEKLFQKVMALMPDGVQKIMSVLVWEAGPHDVGLLEKKLQVVITKKNIQKKYGQHVEVMEIDDSYLFFPAEASHSDYFQDCSIEVRFWFPDIFRQQLKKYLPPPVDYNLNPVSDVDRTEFVFEDNGMILKDFSVFCGYIQMGNLKRTKDKSRILKSSIKQMTKSCSIKEYYDSGQNDLANLRTQLTAEFLSSVNFDKINSGPEALRKLFDNFFETRDFQNLHLADLLFYIKGRSYVYCPEEEQEITRDGLRVILASLPENSWVSLDNIIKFSLYRELDFRAVGLISGDYGYGNGYINTPYDRSRGDFYAYREYQRIDINLDNYTDTILVPFLKTMMFVFAGFGLLDIAYNLPENEIYRDKDNPYLSVCDGLKYVRLTELGQYVLGKREHFDDAFQIQEAFLALDEKRLLIHVEGDDPLKMMALEKFGEKISSSCFKVDSHSFLKGCNCVDDLHMKRQLFYDLICSKPPHIWQDFLDDIINKTDPLTPEDSIMVFKLRPDKEILFLIAKDEVLKKNILKMEDFHIAVHVKNIGKVKNRLKKFGYFINKM